MTGFLTRLLDLIERLILDPLIWVFPFKWCVVQKGSKAVRFTRGLPGDDLGPGWHFATSTQEFETQHCRRCVLSTPDICALTQDGIPLSFDVVVTYQIHRLGEFLTAMEEGESQIGELAQAIARDTVQRGSYVSLLKDVNQVQGHMLEDLTDELLQYGITVLDARFQNIEHLDPQARALLASKASLASLTDLVSDLSPGEILTAISPAIQYVALAQSRPVMLPAPQTEPE